MERDGAMVVRDITTGEYAGFQQLIGDESGITLSPAKKQLLVGRVARTIRERGLRTYGEYLDIVRTDRSGHELVRLLDLVSTNETRFFRETPHYAYLRDVACPRWRQEGEAGHRSRTVRVWSAACSTGQEPYSIGMTLLDLLPVNEGWSVEILASDISTRTLDVAAAGRYDITKADDIPTDFLKRYMLRGIGAHTGSMSVTPELRALVRFLRVNLHAEEYPVPGSFDLIFCSNALIYFSRAGRGAVVERLASRLAPRGNLFVGHAESLHDHRGLLRTVAPTVYGLADSLNQQECGT